MPQFETSQEWLTQSSLLLQARPTTTRITSKYNVLSPTSAKITKKRSKRPLKTNPESTTTTTTTATPPEAPLAAFILKTYDPVSGACLKYKTDKAAEVGRLVGCLGRLGRSMAALPEMGEDQTPDHKDDVEDRPEQKNTPASAVVSTPPQTQGSGGKKKKKGRK
ncbi:hypothetical protein EJ05DRAFT_506525 [Pseudovirgaria hyperparasitica]|uniref:SRP9 domain-containing protein n=1 Tax=Pseudovirgaria hyperparasitica TaxID=470096 RepID=A0A6A6WKX6_9PEZI|nr:uncharacterized protein EJ05DRAFT_506525 [Pseudovirgaria hyperparasitica]KAF2762854.1 hypothetical protein EJ05DRAFT_506525 [Pseudovirgaria hyperparasitica]